MMTVLTVTHCQSNRTLCAFGKYDRMPKPKRLLRSQSAPLG
jgi:hypothetical protein